MPLDLKVKSLPDIPYTISYVIRKRQQIDSYNELPSDKRPSEEMIWDWTPEELDTWFDRIFKKKEQQEVMFDLSDVEG